MNPMPPLDNNYQSMNGSNQFKYVIFSRYILSGYLTLNVLLFFLCSKRLVKCMHVSTIRTHVIAGLRCAKTLVWHCI